MSKVVIPELIVDSNTCNICTLKMGGGDESCPGHYQILPHLWNQDPGFKVHQQHRFNMLRKQQRLPSLEFGFKSPKQFVNT